MVFTPSKVRHMLLSPCHIGGHMAQSEDLIGRRFGRLRVVAFSEKTKRHCYWLCMCDCGLERRIEQNHLRTGHTQSCGCLARETLAQSRTTHGLRHHPLYPLWTNIKQRCRNPKNPRYADYGGRGIDLCSRWECFATFVADMGPRPSLSHSIERCDNDLGYTPENCVWATQQTQSANRRPFTYRRSKRIEYEGETLTIYQLSDRLGIAPSTLYKRLSAGRPLDEPIDSRFSTNRAAASSQRNTRR